jgi:hypothetical protein
MDIFESNACLFIWNDQEKVDQFLPPLKHHINHADLKCKGEIPVTVPATIDRGSLGFVPGYPEYNSQCKGHLNGSISVNQKANKEFNKIFGRSYGNGFIMNINEDCRIAILSVMALAAGTRLLLMNEKEGIKLDSSV